MSIKVFILSFGAASLTTLYWKYLTNPEDVHNSLISLFAGLVSMLVLFLPPHVVAWWHQYDTKQCDRMVLRWVFGVCAVLLLTFGLACDAWHYEFLRWSDVGYNAINSYVDCRFEKALNDCCPAACVDLNMKQNVIKMQTSQRFGDWIWAKLVSELTNDSCHNMTHNWNWTSDCDMDAPWKGLQIVVDLPRLLKVEL